MLTFMLDSPYNISMTSFKEKVTVAIEINKASCILGDRNKTRYLPRAHIEEGFHFIT